VTSATEYWYGAAGGSAVVVVRGAVEVVVERVAGAVVVGDVVVVDVDVVVVGAGDDAEEVAEARGRSWPHALSSSAAPMTSASVRLKERV